MTSRASPCHLSSGAQHVRQPLSRRSTKTTTKRTETRIAMTFNDFKSIIALVTGNPPQVAAFTSVSYGYLLVRFLDDRQPLVHLLDSPALSDGVWPFACSPCLACPPMLQRSVRAARLAVMEADHELQSPFSLENRHPQRSTRAAMTPPITTEASAR